MQKHPIKNNPAFLTDEELAKAFVVRHDDLNLIMRVIRDNTSDSNQHILVIGPRGIGKTMLILRVALQVRRDEELVQEWYPLIFSEESYEVGTAGEFWLESLFHLGHQTGDPKWIRTYDDLKREPVEERLCERALAQLLDFSDNQRRRILLIVENLNIILGDQISEDHAWKLRGTLMHESRLMLLATATARIDLPENTNKAMFEMFKPIVLPPLNNEECQAVWKSVAGQELGTRRIRAIRILTGGNPRLLAIISHFGARLSFAELMQDMTSLVDDHTEYFKSQLDSLPPTERKVYVALADLWDPSRAREVAVASRMDVSQTSSLLKRLVSRSAVIEIYGKVRTKRYQVAERMYNIYYLMRRRGAPSDRVKAVVQFMVQFYEETELIEIAKRLTEEAYHLSNKCRQHHYLAFEGIIRTSPPGLRTMIMQYTPWGFLEASDRPESLRQLLIEVGVGTDCPCDIQKHPDKRIFNLMVKGNKATSEGLLEVAEETFREILDIDDTYPDAWWRLGLVLEKQPGRKGEAEQAFRKAVDIAPIDPCSWDYLGHFLVKDQSSQIEAEHAFRKALESYPDCNHAWLGLAYLAHGEPGKEQTSAQCYHEAEEACVRKTQRYPDRVSHWRNLAHIRHRYTRRYSEAESAYRRLIELDPNDASAYEHLGTLLHHDMERYRDAEVAYRRAMELDPKSISTIGNLGQLLRDHLGGTKEAKELFEKIIETDSSNSQRAWVEMGKLYEGLERFNEAESAYHKALEIDPRFHMAWYRLGILLHERLERYTEAETSYHKTLEIDPRFHMAWYQLGVLLHKRLKRYTEAETAYRKAIEIDQHHSCPKTKLVELMLTGLKQPDRALEVAEELLAAMPGNTNLLNNLAWMFFKLRSSEYLPHAENWARKAVALEDDLTLAHTLACVLALEGKTAEAFQFIRKLLDSPKFVEANIDDMVTLFTQLVKAGIAEEAFHVLQKSNSVVALEPVAIALQMHMGIDVYIATEISEVAKDILRQFQGHV